jgi:hypothetical protein
MWRRAIRATHGTYCSRSFWLRSKLVGSQIHNPDKIFGQKGRHQRRLRPDAADASRGCEERRLGTHFIDRQRPLFGLVSCLDAQPHRVPERRRYLIRLRRFKERLRIDIRCPTSKENTCVRQLAAHATNRVAHVGGTSGVEI